MPTRKPKSTPVALARAKAQTWAKSELVDRHRDEYDALYAFYLKELGLSARRDISTRPSAKVVA